MKNTTAMADYELRHIEALRKNLAGCTVLLKKDGSFPLEKPCTLAAYGSGVRRTILVALSVACLACSRPK